MHTRLPKILGVETVARVRANPSMMARFRACFDREVAARMAAYHAEGVG